MKYITLLLLFFCTVSVNLSAQVVTYDSCGELRVAMATADRLIEQRKLDEALEKLNKFKNDPEMKDCPEMKDGILDFKINDVKKRIAERDGLLISYKQCPDDNHPHLIDLGLPSGTKWACCNVGAKKPEDYGGYYAWGEIEEKSGEYSWKTYKYYDSSSKKCQSLVSICGTQYDVAHVKWGGSWQMPTVNQIQELLDNSNSVSIKKNGVYGRKFTSKKNGASIFLPWAGDRGGVSPIIDRINTINDSGYYWSGTQGSKGDSAYSLDVDYRLADWDRSYRYVGYSVRPVAK